MKKRILVIDDETMILDAIKIVFEEMGCDVDVYSDSTEGLAEALRGEHDLILVDVRMPVKNGAEVTEEILGHKPGARVLVITAYADDPLAARALKAGAIGLMRKPFEIARVLDFLE